MANRRFKPKNRPRKRRFYKRMGFWATLFLFGGVAAGAGWVAFVHFTAPYREQAEHYDLEAINDLEVPSLIFDRNGKEIGRIFVENRSIIPISEIPEQMVGALKSGEDRRFDTHDGVDYIGIVRAAYLNWKADEVNQGASTLTQQLARNAFDLKSRAKRLGQNSYERKLVEVFLARRIEKRYAKSQILEFYLNRIYFGSGFYGVRSAALGYFGREPRDLTPLQCATLVGLIKRPNDLSPLKNPKACKKSRDRVLLRMLEDRRITRKQWKVWSKQPVRVNPKPLKRGTSHVYERIAAEARERLGEESFSEGGYKIFTTIDKGVQEAAERKMQEVLARAEALPGYSHPRMADYRRSSGKPPEFLQGALLMVDHSTGEVLAHVGGRNYADAPFDFVEMGRRPAGTVFFPFIYAAGFESGLSPATVVDDDPMDNRSVMIGGREGILGEWGMEIGRPRYEGKITARHAFEQSKIAATVRFGTKAGLKRVVETAQHFGLRFPSDLELLPRILVGWEDVSLPELVRGIAAFGRGGVLGAGNLVYVERIENGAGEVVYRRRVRPESRVQATDAATAYQLHSMMQGVLEHGNAADASRQLIQKPFLGGGKGGTAHDFSDCWFAGYNSRISCGVWVGFLQGSGQPIYEGAFSKDLAMPIWVAAMNAARPAFGGREIKPPPTLRKISVCRVSGQKATRYCYETVEDPETGMPVTRPTVETEWLRTDKSALPFCSVHGGGGGEMVLPGTGRGGLSIREVVSAIPIRPHSPVVLGEDPYNSVPLAMSGEKAATAVSMRRVRHQRMLESLELGDKESEIGIPRPRRLDIFADERVGFRW